MKLPPHVRRVKCIIKLFLVAVAVLVLVCTLVLKQASLDDLTEAWKCPACFGSDFCLTISSGDVRLRPFISWINAKNVYFGRWEGRPVALKKLGHDWELNELDVRLCNLMGQTSSCSLSDLTWRLDDVHKAIFSAVQPMDNTNLRAGIAFCPVAEAGQIDELVQRVSKRSKETAYKSLLIHVLTMFVLNPEPVILQAFPAEEGWPFPKYLGSCGRVTAQEYVGADLNSYENADWRFRAKIALQLLQIAQKLTFHDTRFSLYMTDVTAENLAIDEKGDVKVVDLGNIIIVDKYPPLHVRPEGWKEPHTSDILEECENCFSYSREDICGHRTSDHNYYAVCQFLGRALWLRDPPEDVHRAYPQLEELLRECAEPQMVKGRYKAVRQLLPLLANLTLA